MISKLLRFALQQRFITLVLSIALVGLGVYSFRRLKIEAYPDISDTQVTVITSFPGQAAEEMEQQVTIPIERALNSTPAVIARRSRTIYELSVVELTFAYGTDDYFARQLVLERLRDATLPDGVTPSLAPLSTPIGEMYRFTLDGTGYDEMQLRELEDWVVSPRLLQVSGVADVVPFGGLIKQYQVVVTPAMLEKHNLTIGAVATAIKNNNRNAGGAVLDSGQQSMVIRGVGRIRSVADIENIVLAAPRGVPVLVGNVASVRIGPAPPTGIFGLGAKAGGVEGIVLMRRGENPSEVLRDLKQAVEEINTTRLPHGVRITAIYDRSELVDNTLHTVSRTLLEGFTIVVLVLVFFLGSLRAALLTALTIPLALLFAFICMNFYGIPANLLSLGALDFGIIVDGTLVMVEHILKTLAEGQSGSAPRSPLESIRRAALEIERPIFFSLVILIAAYLPLFTLERVERRLFTPMAFTVCSALLGSMLFTLTLIPVMATYLFRRNARGWENPVVRWLSDRYEGMLQICMVRPLFITAFAGLAVSGGAIVATLLGSEFLPQLDEGVIWIRANLPPGISLAESAKIATDIRRLVAAHPEVKLVSSQTGRNDSGTDPFGPNRNEFFVALTPYKTWAPGRNKTALVDDMRQELTSQIPGVMLNFTQPIIDTVTESVTGSSADLAVIISGPDLARLRDLANRTLAMIGQVPGSTDSAIEQEADQAGLRIQIDRARIARYGLNVDDITGLIESAVGGRAVSTLFEGERQFDITTRFEAGSRSDVTGLANILVHTADGGRVPLGQLAEIQVVNGASIIARRENQRQISVRTNIRNRDQGSFVKEAQARMEKEIQLPAGYQIDWGGQFENLERARRRMSIVLPITIAIIFTMLFFAFGSTVSASLVLLNVPFSIVGGLVALYLRGINLSVSAVVGFISLFGVAVMSGVLYVSAIERWRREENVSLELAVLLGARSQLQPALLLIVVALLGMIPAATAKGIGSDVQRPLATVVVGGLISTMFLTVPSLPILYYLVERRRARRAR